MSAGPSFRFREDELAAEAMGLNDSYKALAFVISSALAGMAGSCLTLHLVLSTTISVHPLV